MGEAFWSGFSIATGVCGLLLAVAGLIGIAVHRRRTRGEQWDAEEREW